jgi:hypothetical protein
MVCELCRKRAERLGWVDPAAPGANVGKRDPEAREAPHSRLERAVSRFNASESARTVAGLMRSLGEPWVSVGAAAGSPSEVRITVAWELSWYQWEVSGDGNGVAVREIAQGKEVSELAEDARAWNAAVAEDGKLRLRSASARRKPSSKQA